MNSQLQNYSKQLQHSLADLSWANIGSNLIHRFVYLLLATVIFGLILWLGKAIINTIFKQTKRIEFLGGFHRAATFKALTLNIFRYTTYLCYLYAILSLIGVPVGTLIAGAGIFSIALGLGAQSFVSDVVNGFFILLEEQFDVDDLVDINGVKGRIAGIGLRTTRVLSPDGTLNFIPNRSITIVKNFSRHDAITPIDLQITSTTPIATVEQIIRQENAALMKQPPQGLTKVPKIIGPVDKDGQLVFRIVIRQDSKQSQSTALRATILRHYLNALAKANITLKE